MNAHELQTLVARPNLNNGGKVPPWFHWDGQVRHRHSKNRVELLVESHTLDIGLWLPFLQRDHHVYLLLLADRADSIELGKIHDPQSAYLDVVAQKVGAASLEN